MKFVLLTVLASAGLIAQQAPPAPPKPPVVDDVTRYLDERRAPALRQIAIEDLARTGDENLQAGNFSESEAIYRKVLEQQPNNVHAVKGIVDTYLAQNRAQDALRFLQSTVDEQPRNLTLVHLLADTAVKLGDYDRAIAVYNKALEGRTDRLRGEIYSSLGDVYRRKGDLNSSIAALRQAKTVLPPEAHAGLAVADALSAAGRDREAAVEYRSALGIDPNDTAALVAMATDPQSDPQIAMACAQLARKLSPEDLKVAELLAKLFMRRQAGAWDAIPLYRQMAAAEPGDYTHHYDLALALRMAGDSAGALSEARIALQCNPSQDAKERLESMIAALGRPRE